MPYYPSTREGELYFGQLYPPDPPSELQLVDSPLDQDHEMSVRWIECFALIFGDLEVQLSGDRPTILHGVPSPARSETPPITATRKGEVHRQGAADVSMGITLRQRPKVLRSQEAVHPGRAKLAAF